VSDVTITCAKCAAVSPFDSWKGPRGAELPPNRFQCPRCAWAFERKPKTDRWGSHRIALTPVNPELPLAGGRIL
jgi:hypothetical protein